MQLSAWPRARIFQKVFSTIERNPEDPVSRQIREPAQGVSALPLSAPLVDPGHDSELLFSGTGSNRISVACKNVIDPPEPRLLSIKSQPGAGPQLPDCSLYAHRVFLCRALSETWFMNGPKWFASAGVSAPTKETTENGGLARLQNTGFWCPHRQLRAKSRHGCGLKQRGACLEGSDRWYPMITGGSGWLQRQPNSNPKFLIHSRSY